MGGLARLRRAARASRRLRNLAEADPLSQMQWTPPQLAYLQCPERFVLFRTGNQLGKTTVGLADLIYRLRGEHPFQAVPTGPVEWWILCASHTQSVAIQTKFWNLLAAEERAGHRFDPTHGFSFNNPVYVHPNGSIARFKTSKQDALDLSSATLDGVLADEPPKRPRVFAEIIKRVQARNGPIRMTFTPINAPVDYIREMAEEGKIRDLHYRLEPQNLVPVGSSRPLCTADGRPMDAAWIEEVRSLSLAHEIPVVCDGEWETRVADRLFEAFVSDPNVEGTHVVRRAPRRTWRICLGIDHGTAKGNEVAVLVLVDESESVTHPNVYVVDEYAPEGIVTADDDAQGILDLLERNGLSYGDLDVAWGDIPAGHGVARKGNLDLEDALARKLGLRNRRALPVRIGTAKRGRGNARGSIAEGARFLHRLMVHPDRFRVLSRCERMVEALDKWDGASDDRHSHPCDALRYALKDYVFGRRRAAVGRGLSLSR